MDKEIWKPIPGYSGYDVSNMGRIRSYFKSYGRLKQIDARPQRLLKFSTISGRYHGVNLSRDGKPHPKSVHDVVALTFIGPKPGDMVTIHKDGDTFNDKADNLKYVTRSEAHLGKQMPEGENAGMSKLTNAQARDIREQFRPGNISTVELARQYGVQQPTISLILKGKTYKMAGGPTYKKIGEQRVRKLTNDEVREIRERYANNNTSLSQIANRYGITRGAASLIVNGKRKREAGGPIKGIDYG